MGQGKCDGMRPELGMRQLDKQTHERKTDWLQLLQGKTSGRDPKQLRYYQPVGRQEEDGFMFADGMG
jgi:hypothetical protein